MKHHDTLPPSSFPALQKCGHFTPERSPEQRAPNGDGEPHVSESPFAQRGSRIDKLFMDILDPDKRIIGKINTDEHDADEWECAKWMATETSKLIPDIKGLQTMVEIYDELWLNELITFGTCDAWGYNGDKLILCDGKSGIFRDYSAQLAIYALGLMDKEGKGVCHAYCVFGDLQMVSEYYFKKAQCEALLRDTIAAQANPNAPYSRNQYCEWCSFRPKCPAWLAPASLAVSALKPELGKQLREGLDLLMTNPALMGEFYGGWLDAKKIVEDYDIPGKMMQFINGGTGIEGWTIRSRKGSRHYANNAILALIQSGHDLKEIVRCLKIAPEELDKLIKRHPGLEIPPPYVSPDQKFVTRTKKNT